MRHLISERKLGFVILSLFFGVFLFSKATLFNSPVIISEKGILQLIVAGILLLIGVWFAIGSRKRA